MTFFSRPLSAILVFASLAAPASAGKIVIAHRGASGYLPEHTLEAYAVAHAQGAHYIEPDIVLTKDKHFICRHDIHLEDTTDVEQVFPDRKREDGKWYAADFTLEEIKRLRSHERHPDRFPVDASKFEVPTFAEMIELVQGLNQTTGREAGIYPELKSPGWHRAQGLPMEQAFLDLVREHAYSGKDAKIFVQCFEPETLKRLRELGSQLPQILLIGGGGSFSASVTPEGLAEAAAYADGIGPSKTRFVKDPDLAKRAHESGLLVHPYTVSARTYESATKEFEEFYVNCDVDGLFVDYPDLAVRFLTD